MLLHGRYRLQAKLGSGGMADVFLADDERLGRQVAVKVLRRSFDDGDEQLVRRFQVEAVRRPCSRILPSSPSSTRARPGTTGISSWSTCPARR